MYRFQYHRAKTLDEAVKIFSNSEDGIYLAGGQTLIPTLKQRLAAPSDVIDLAAIQELHGIGIKNNTISVGAFTCHADVANSKDVQNLIPALSGLAKTIGDPQIRNLGTIGGSIANNDPAADYPAAVLSLGANVHTNKRIIVADAFFTDLFETALEEGEIITSVSFPVPLSAVYEKFPNPVSRYALVGVFVAIFEAEVRVAVTGAKACVFRMPDMEAALMRKLSPQSVDEIEISEENINEDIHASASYRSHLISVMAKKAVKALS